MKKQILKLMSMALILSLLLCCLPVEAEDGLDGWISIKIGEKNSPFDRKGIILGAYLIARGDYGDWTMEPAFADIQVFVHEGGSASISEALGEIDKRIDDQGIKPIAKEESNGNGKVQFKKLPHGIYFIRMESQSDLVKINPMLASVPNKDGAVQQTVPAKYEYYTPAPTDTPTPKPTLTPFVTPSPTPTVPDADKTTPPPDDAKQTPTPTPWKPAKPTKPPVATPSPTPDEDHTPIPPNVPQLSPNPDEDVIPIEDYETALGLGNIQMHVGVCYE